MSFSITKSFSTVLLMPDLGTIHRVDSDVITVTIEATAINNVSGGYAEVQFVSSVQDGAQGGVQGLLTKQVPYDGTGDILILAEAYLLETLQTHM